MTLRADDQMALAPPSDDEIIAAWEGGKAGEPLTYSVPRRFQVPIQRMLCRPIGQSTLFETRDLRVLVDAWVAGWDKGERTIAEAKRGNGRRE